jgi:hypothetical protein
VIAQSKNEFTWLIYCETSTPPMYLAQITSLVRAYPYIQIRLVNGYFGCMEDIDVKLTKAQTEYVITSRMDNDDAIGIDYINIIQSHFIPQDKTLINLLHGYSYIPGQHVATRLYHIQRNSFCSFVEERLPMGGHISVRGFPHGSPPPGTNMINVDSRYSWLKVFHDRNLLSKPFGYPVFTNNFSVQYSIDKKHLEINIVSTLGYCLTWALDGLYRKTLHLFNSERTIPDQKVRK